MNINEFQTRIDEPFDGDGSKQRRRPCEKKVDIKVISVRVIASILLTLLLAASLGWTWLYTVAKGPSETYRDNFVRDMMASDSTKWIPYLVLPSSEIDSIMQGGEVHE